jgi:hypothetical protein
MNKSKKCLKCGHLARFTDQPPEACPACDAVYSKVEAAAAHGGGALPRPARLLPGTRSRTGQATTPDPDFVAAMRADSLYPNFRSLARLTTWLCYVVGAGFILVTIFQGTEESMGRIGVILATLVMMVIATAAKEASLMLADLSDAAVCIAPRENSSA